MTITTRETSTDYGRPFRPWPVAAVNGLGRLAKRLGWRGVSLSEMSLLSAAQRRTGLSDFGDDQYREALSILIAALEDEARLNPVGRLMARENLIRVLKNRLLLQADLERYPEILESELEPPLFIVGLQRTGTTVVHRTLAEHPENRVLMSWEAINPAPQGPLDGRGLDPRVRTAKIAEVSLRFLAPDFFAIHPVEAESPEEDCLLMDYAFLSTVPEATQQVPSFSEWLEEQDHRRAYEFLEVVLKYLSWQRPGGRWILKSPHHLEHLDIIGDVFPGSQIIWTHRDPARALASFCSMMSHAYGVFSDHVDPHDVGRRWLRKTSHMVRSAMDARKGWEGAPFVDVFYPELMANPLGEVERIARELGRPFPAEVEAAVRGWFGRNPQHKHGRHRYGLEHFGLEQSMVDERFAEYRARFDLDVEEGSNVGR